MSASPRSRVLVFGAVLLLGFAAGSRLGLRVEKRAANPLKHSVPEPSDERQPDENLAAANVERTFASLMAAARDPDVLRGSFDFEETLRNVREEETTALLGRMFRLPGHQREKWMPVVFARLCERYPEAATQALRNLPIWERSRMFTSGISSGDDALYRAWARFAPQQVLAEAQKHPQGSAIFLAVRSLTEAQAGADPQRQFAYAQQLPAGRAHDLSMHAALSNLAKNDPQSALNLAESLKPGPRRDAIFENCFRAWVGTDREAALAELARRAPSLSAGARGNSLIETTVTFAARKDPARTAEWTLGLPETLRLPAAMVAVGEWVNKEPLAALTWAYEQGVPIDVGGGDGLNETANNHVVASFGSPVTSAAREAPEELAQWLRTLPDAERERLTEHALATRMQPEQMGKLRAALGR
jgi:hypothetical protein